jgi:hypothetical protein
MVGGAVGLAAAGIAVPLGVAVLRAGGNPILATPFPTVLRLVVGVAVLHALAAVFAVALAARVRRAALLALAALVVPYALATLPLLPDPVADALLITTPAAGFAAAQTLVEYAHATAHHSPPMGYFPLSWWVGLGVLTTFTAAALAFAFAAMRNNGLRSVRRETRME